MQRVAAQVTGRLLRQQCARVGLASNTDSSQAFSTETISGVPCKVLKPNYSYHMLSCIPYALSLDTAIGLANGDKLQSAAWTQHLIHFGNLVGEFLWISTGFQRGRQEASCGHKGAAWGALAGYIDQVRLPSGSQPA